jgi:hypothetical protein
MSGLSEREEQVEVIGLAELDEAALGALHLLGLRRRP